LGFAPQGELLSAHLLRYVSCEGISIPCETCLEDVRLKARRIYDTYSEVPWTLFAPCGHYIQRARINLFEQP